MRNLQSLSWCGILVVILAPIGVSAAHAAHPEDRVITYSIREDPQDAESDVTFLVSLKLTAVDREDSTVAWRVVYAKFEQLDEFGEPLAAWMILYPQLDTSDGYWWVEHEEYLEPVPEEFHSVPTLEGSAPALDEEDPDLDFFVETGSCTGGCTSMYGGQVTALNHAFVVAGEPEPIEEGDDEPSEIEEDNNPS